MTIALLALLLAQDPEPVQPPPAPPAAVSTDAMREAMHTYVRGERRSIIPFSLMALSSFVAGGVLLTSNEAIARGAAWPLLGFGVLELAAGLFFGLRNERPHLDALLGEDPQKFADAERKKVTRIASFNQPLLLGIEGVLLAAGGAMAGAGAVARQGTVEGVGIGVAISALAMFLVDWAVLDRADDYLGVLKHFRPVTPP